MEVTHHASGDSVTFDARAGWIWGSDCSADLEVGELRGLRGTSLLKSVSAIPQALDRAIGAGGRLAQTIANRGRCDLVAVDSLGLVDHLLWSQRLVGGSQDLYDEFEHPAWSSPLWCVVTRHRITSPSSALDCPHGLGHAPKLNPGFRVRKAARKLYSQPPVDRRVRTGHLSWRSLRATTRLQPPARPPCARYTESSVRLAR